MRLTPQQKAILGLFWPLYLPSFLFSFSNNLLLPILPLYAQGFEVSYALVGVVLAGDAIGMLVGDLPAGLLMRRMGQKSAMIAGLGLSGLSTAGLFWAPSLAWVVLLRMIAGLGVSLFSVSRHYFLAEMAPPQARGRIISLFGGFFRLGRLLGPIAGGSIAALLGLRASFLIFGLICLAALLVVVYFLPEVEVARGEGAAGESGSALEGFVRMLSAHYRVLGTAGVGYLFMQIVRSGPPVILPLYAANVLHLDVQTIGLLLSTGSSLDLAMFYPAGIVMDRYGRKYAILSSCLLLSMGLALIPFTGSFAALLGAAMIAGLGGGLGSGAMLTIGSDLAPARGRSEFLGAWTLIGDVGNTSGPLVTGILADYIPLAQTGWAVALGGVTAMLIFGLLVPETLKKRARMG
jgi:MFS family permease